VNVVCIKCCAVYDDAECWTICPHELFMPREDLERKKRALEIIGKKVRFRHQSEKGPDYLVQCVCWNGMIELEGLVGEFAPDLFVVSGI
jgi:hypothetical protein